MSLAHVEMVANRPQAAVPSPVPLVAKRAYVRQHAEAVRSGSAGIAVGMILVAILPAVFWTGCVWMVSNALGVPLSGSTLTIVTVAIAGFLTIIGTALMAAR